MELEVILLHEISKKMKNNYWIVLFICKVSILQYMALVEDLVLRYTVKGCENISFKIFQFCKSALKTLIVKMYLMQFWRWWNESSVVLSSVRSLVWSLQTNSRVTSGSLCISLLLSSSWMDKYLFKFFS